MLKENEILNEFLQLAEFLNDIDWITEIHEKSEELPMTLLTASLPMSDDDPMDFVCSFIPLEDVEFSKLMQIFTRIPIDISAISISDTMKIINAFNTLCALGGFLYDTKLSVPCISMKYTVIGSEEEPFDEGIIAESLLMMVQYCQMMESFLQRCIQGDISVDELLKENMNFK